MECVHNVAHKITSLDLVLSQSSRFARTSFLWETDLERKRERMPPKKGTKSKKKAVPSRDSEEIPVTSIDVQYNPEIINGLLLDLQAHARQVSRRSHGSGCALLFVPLLECVLYRMCSL